jgi:putative selenium metabolism hydrolase
LGDYRVKIFEEILERTKRYEGDLVNLLKRFISIPSFSGKEEKMAENLLKEMESIGFDDVFVDPLGNVIGTCGRGSLHIAYDGHMDTVDVGNPERWEVDPFKGELREGCIYGRGSTDQKGGIASVIYAVKVLKDMGLLDGFKITLVGSVLEEAREGVSWQHIINEGGIKPDYVVLTEPTNLEIKRGHLGRTEIEIEVRGISAHGSIPEMGRNAIEESIPILKELLSLRDNLPSHPVLGRGKLTVTEINSSSPSLCAVPDRVVIHIDRRLTLGEDEKGVLKEIENLKSIKGGDTRVYLVKDPIPGYTGFLYKTDLLYPPWILEEDDPFLKRAIKTYETLFKSKPVVGTWRFSTNGVVTYGLYKIPTIGFGPGKEEVAHTPNEFCPIDHLVKATAFYASLPLAILNY